MCPGSNAQRKNRPLSEDVIFLVEKKVVRGFLDGGTKTKGGSGCGVVIKGVYRDNWSTIS